MLAKDFYDRCNDDTKRFIDFYITTMWRFNTKLSDIVEDFLPVYKDDGNNLSNVNSVVLYFFFLLFKAQPYIKNLFDKYKVEILNKFIVPDKAQEEIRKTYKDYYVAGLKLNDYYRELFFNNLNAYASSLIKAFSPTDRNICIERIIINIIKERKCIGNSEYCSLENEDLFKELEELAAKKEDRVIPKARKVSNLKLGVGEVLTDKEYPYNPLIGREQILRKMCALLMDKEKSLIVHGLPGVGKTTLINGLAYNINKGNVPKRLIDKQVVEVQASELVRGCKYVGMVEDRLLEIIDKLLNANAILFIDEIHTLMGLGKGENSTIDVSNILKPYLGNGRIKIVGATTTKEYNIILEDGAFARRFNGLEIKVPTNKETLNILYELLKRYKETEGIDFFTDEDLKNKILQLIISFSNRKNPNAILQKELYNPDLALTILRNAFDFAMVDDKNEVDVYSLIEGFDSMDYFRDPAKEEFKEKALALTRTKNGVYVIS